MTDLTPVRNLLADALEAEDWYALADCVREEKAGQAAVLVIDRALKAEREKKG